MGAAAVAALAGGLLVPGAAQDWQARPAAAASQAGPSSLANGLQDSLEDLRLAAEGYKPSLNGADLAALLADHLDGPRELRPEWRDVPRRAATGGACSLRSEPRCPAPEQAFCFDVLLGLLLQETSRALAFVKGLLESLEAALAMAQRGRSDLPPLSGKALAAAQALDSVLALFLGLLERADHSPKLGACLLGTPFGHAVRRAVLSALRQQKSLGVQVRELQTELATSSRLSQARYGLQVWHADSARHIAAAAGWALFGIAKLGGYVEKKRAVPGGGALLLRANRSALDADADDGAELLLRGHPALGPGQLPLRFLHIPRSAGSALEAAAEAKGIAWGRNLLGEERVEMPDKSTCSRFHVPPALLPDGGPGGGQASYRSAEVFCVVRHPYGRAVSQYSYLLGAPWGAALAGEALVRHPACSPEGLNHFLRSTLRRLRSEGPYILDCHFVPQSDFVFGPDGRRWCSTVLRMEELPDAANRLFEARGYSVHLGREKENSGRERCPSLSDADLSTSVRAELEEVYAADFAKLGFNVR